MRDPGVFRDTASPLWVVRCARPCGRNGADWCMTAQDLLHSNPAPRTCWIGSAGTQKGAQASLDRLLATPAAQQAMADTTALLARRRSPA